MRFRTRTARSECWMRLGMFSSSSGWPPVSIMWTSSSISGLSVFLDDLTSLNLDYMVELLAAGEDSGRWGLLVKNLLWLLVSSLPVEAVLMVNVNDMNWTVGEPYKEQLHVHTVHYSGFIHAFFKQSTLKNNFPDILRNFVHMHQQWFPGRSSYSLGTRLQ